MIAPTRRTWVGRYSPAIVLAFLALTCWLGRARSAEAPVLPLSLDRAVQLGLERNEDLGIAASKERGAKADAAAARSALLPQISSQSGYERQIRSPFGTDVSLDISGIDTQVLLDRLSDAQRNRFSSSVSASQLIYDGAVFARARIARVGVEVRRLELGERQLDVALQIVSAYYAAVLADTKVGITGAAIAQADETLRHTRMKKGSGKASDLDVLNVEVDRNNLEPERIDALNSRDVALRNLKRLIDWPANMEITLTDSLVPEGFPRVSAQRLDEIAAGALGRRPEVQAARRTIGMKELEIGAAKQARWPSLHLQADMNRSGYSENGLPSNHDYFDDWRAGVFVRVPLFDGGLRGAGVANAREQKTQAELHRAQVEKDVALDLAQQRGELDRAAAAIEARTHTVELAETRHRLMAMAWEQGLANTLQLSDARLQLREARVNEVEALHDYRVALAGLMRTSGLAAWPLN